MRCDHWGGGQESHVLVTLTTSRLACQQHLPGFGFYLVMKEDTGKWGEL